MQPIVIAAFGTLAVNFTAFETRLTNTWLRSAGSPKHGGSGATDRSMARPEAAIASCATEVAIAVRSTFCFCMAARPIRENASRSSISWPMRLRVHLDALEVTPRVGIELGAVILVENLHEAGDGAQRRAQVVRHRIAERLELPVGGEQFRRPRLDAQLEIESRPCSTFSAIVLNESARRPISSLRSISTCTCGRDSATASAASVTCSSGVVIRRVVTQPIAAAISSTAVAIAIERSRNRCVGSSTAARGISIATIHGVSESARPTRRCAACRRVDSPRAVRRRRR